MKTKLVLAARLALALPLLVFGLDGLLNFLPPETYPDHGPRAAEFLRVVQGSGYVWQLMKLTELAVGLALLVGKVVPLALVVIAPVIVNILGFHLTMEHQGTWLALYLVALASYLAWVHRSSYRTLFVESPPEPDSG